ncbi:group 1 truncated hemoglobin [Neptunicella marina]|uniref:Group 1 truncated hemoglobin n=2 Tax=Neptunicella marina TaxID=2125989 RepID=A0A8J6IMT6_9ALTE|nr:group 1 truncated hemoglobin [Neptunicella marina]
MWRKCVIGLFATIMLGGCQNTPEQTLYQRLGGQQGVEKLVDNFINQIGHDKQIFHFFADSKISHFRQGFIQHLCAVSDGPCRYTGDSMVDIHTGMMVKEGDFNHVVELLINAMDDSGIETPVQNALLARLAPLRSGIIYR